MKTPLSFLLLSLVALPTFVSALTLNLDYPKFGPFDLNVNQSLAEIIGFFYYFIVGTAGLAAFVMLVWGGVQWLASGAVPSQAAEAKDKIRNAILGLLLVLASFLIIQVINPELTILSGAPYPPIDCSTLGGACNPLSGLVADGTTAARPPKGATKDGIYLCKQKQCACATDPCKEGTDPGSADYLYIDPSIVGIATGSGGPGVTSLGSWNDEVKAVAIKGDYGVLLADDPSFGGVATCFNNSSGGNLHEFERIRNSLDPKTPFKRWDENGAQSLEILKGGLCRASGITLAKESHFWAGGDVIAPTVYFFEVIKQGKSGEVGKPSFLRYKVPVAYCGDLGFCPGPTNSASPLLIPGPTVPEAPSLYLVPGVEFAVRLYQSDPPTTSLTMCFKNSIDNLSLYAWGVSDPPKLVSKEIKWIQGIADPQCPEEGKPTPP